MMDKIEEIAKAIQIKEGFYPPNANYPKGSVSYRCNNPGNILYGDLAKSLGAFEKYTSSLGLTYAVFPTFEAGFYALKVFLMLAFSGQLKSYKKEMALKEFFKIYSGGGETYGQFVSEKTGIPVETMVGKIYDNEWQPETLNKIPLEYFWQRNPRYKNIKLGNSNLSFQSYGCFTCCLAYMAEMDPIDAMEKIKKGGGYSGALIISDKAAKALELKYLGKETNINNPPDWSPSIKEVLLGKSQHFVVRLDKKIFDTWTGQEQKQNFYPFKSYRFFKNEKEN